MQIFRQKETTPEKTETKRKKTNSQHTQTDHTNMLQLFNWIDLFRNEYLQYTAVFSCSFFSN